MRRIKPVAQHGTVESYLITYEELASLTKISRRTWERQVNKGEVPGVTRIGHSVRFNWPLIQEWLAEMGDA